MLRRWRESARSVDNLRRCDQPLNFAAYSPHSRKPYAAGTQTAAGLAYDLMIAAGRAADGMITSSRQRLLAHLSGGDPEGAALEMERHLRVLHYMGRLADCAVHRTSA